VWSQRRSFNFSMAAITSTCMENGQWGLAVKDVFLIPMAAIGIPGKEHGQCGLSVKMEKKSMAPPEELIKSMGNKGWQSKKFLKFLMAAIRRTGKEYGLLGLAVKNLFKISYNGYQKYWQGARAMGVGSPRHKISYGAIRSTKKITQAILEISSWTF
jgi:hypothetical protein